MKVETLHEGITDKTGEKLVVKKNPVPKLNKYKSLHLWMLLSMLVMQFGIFRDYWGDFTDNAWSVDVHYWTGTVWYFFLII